METGRRGTPCDVRRPVVDSFDMSTRGCPDSTDYRPDLEVSSAECADYSDDDGQQIDRLGARQHVCPGRSCSTVSPVSSYPCPKTREMSVVEKVVEVCFSQSSHHAGPVLLD